MKGFRQFILRGNVVDLAVGVVMGAAFGTVVSALVKDFLTPLIAAAVYFFVVLPVNALIARVKRGEAPPDPTTKKCPECLSDIPIAARKCAFCTSAIA
jgi:large conductance mechanosensitive channel